MIFTKVEFTIFCFISLCFLLNISNCDLFPDPYHFEPEDQPPYYHPSLGDAHPYEFDTTKMMIYIMERATRNRPRLHPNGQLKGGNPTKVYVDMHIAGIHSVNELEQSVKLTVNVRTTWYDWRLVYGRFGNFYFSDPDSYMVFHYLDAVFQEVSQIPSEAAKNVPNYAKFWRPDLYFVNERGALRIQNTEPNVMLRLYPNGTVVFSQKLVMKTQCEMKFHRFPLDLQACPLYLSSNNFPDHDIEFRWNEQADGGAVTLSDQLTLPEFIITGATFKDSCNYDNSIPGIANFSCLEAKVHMKRLFAFYFIEIYLPSMMVVVLSWMNFWIDIEAVPARISLGILSVLTTSTQRSGIVHRMPKVSYTKAVDIWMTFCLLMVVFAMLEYSLVNTLAHKAKQKMGNELLSRFMAVDSDESEEDVKMDEAAVLKKHAIIRGRRAALAPLEQTFCERLGQRLRRTIKRLKTNKAYALDVVSRIAFPAVFVLFNIVYWFVYLVIFTENPE